MNTLQYSEFGGYLDASDEYEVTPVLEGWSLEDFGDLVPNDPGLEADYALATAEMELDFG